MRGVILVICLLFPAIFLLSQHEVLMRIERIEKEISSNNKDSDSLMQVLEAYKLENIRNELKLYGIPELNDGDTLIEHAAMMLVYDEFHEQAKWVAHIITPDIVAGNYSRSNDFREDPEVKTGSACEKDYFLKYKNEEGKYKYDGFGYDRGHLAPSADFKWSESALSESYFYSNMSPQLADFNRDGWAKLENMLRAYVKEYKCSLFVVTGGILNDTLRKIERSVNKLSIPDWYYKVVYDPQNSKAIAFVMPNRKLDYPVESYTKTIDEVEAQTAINFFDKLDDEKENELEAQNNPENWLTGKQKGDTPPMTNNLPKGTYNTVQSQNFVDENKTVTICGTVVSTKKTRKGHIFINLDKSFPNHIFTITVWESVITNFSYNLSEELKGKKICVKGKVTDNKGVPTMSIDNEKDITILE